MQSDLRYHENANLLTHKYYDKRKDNSNQKIPIINF